MENEDILLRQPSHMQTVIPLLNDQRFAETFGDIKLVFADGDIFYYKALLASFSASWREILKYCDGADLALFLDVRKQDFLDQMDLEYGGTIKEPKCFNIPEEHNYNRKDDYGFDDQIDFKDELEETIALENSADDASSETAVKEIKKQFTMVTEELSEKDIKKEYAGLGNILEKKIVSAIVPDFTWPAHLPSPNYHSIRWGQYKSTDVFEVMGNRSIFTVLSEKYQDLPCSTAFTLKLSDEDEETAGVFSLRDFVNGGTDKNVPAFIVDGTEEKVSLFELMEVDGWDKLATNERYSSLENATKNTNILLKGVYKDLKGLIKVWKNDIQADSVDQELVGESTTDKDVISWLRSQAKRTHDGGEICCYCGLVCYDQSTSGNFRAHINKHLNRRRFCKPCNEFYKSHEKHLCGKKDVKNEKVPCSECDRIFNSRNNMIMHLRRVHKIIHKVVILRECVFCAEKVPTMSLSSHYLEFHKNEELSCQYCDRKFTNPTKFKAHVDTIHKKVRSGFCKICQKESGNLSQHMKVCHNEKTFPCDHCDKVFKHPFTLKCHMESVNGTREKKPCPECGSLYVNISSHIRKFHRGQKYVAKHKNCPACSKRIKIEEFAAHKLTCKQEETICHVCSKSVVNIKIHLAMIHKVFARRCYLCQEDFHTIFDLNNHLRSNYFPKIMLEAGFLETDLQTEDASQRELIATKLVELYSSTSESEAGQIECKFCGYKTATRINMILHMREHLGFTLRKGKIPDPDKVKKRKLRNVGIRNLPNPAKDKVCPDCGKIVRRQFAAHVKKCKEKLEQLVIQEEPPTVIQGVEELEGLTLDSDGKLVDKEFVVEMEMDVVTAGEINGTTEMLLNDARKTKAKVSEQKEFQCQNCEKSFSKQGYLRKHMKRLHGKKE